ncbi:velvet factor-domain-containing protein [Lipomyces tetrasporus]
MDRGIGHLSASSSFSANNCNGGQIGSRLTRCKRQKRRKYRHKKTDQGIPPHPDRPTHATSEFRMAIANLITQTASPPLTSTDSMSTRDSSPCPSNILTSFPVPQPSTRQHLQITDYELEIRQQPLWCRVAGTGISERAHASHGTVIPNPVIKLEVNDGDPERKWLQSPCFFMRPPNETFAGGIVSSLHRVSDLSRRESGYFIFSDLRIKVEGEFRLRFILFEIQETHVKFIGSTVSEAFTVYSSGRSPEPTMLAPKFSCQGARLRKESGDSSASLVQQSSPSTNKTTTFSQAFQRDHTLAYAPSFTGATVTGLQNANRELSCAVQADKSLRPDNEPGRQNKISISEFSSCESTVSLPTESFRTLETRTWSSGRKPTISGLSARAQSAVADNRKKYDYDGLRRYTFQHLSYFPREQKPYHSFPQPLSRSPRLPIPQLSMAYSQQAADHYNLCNYGQGQLPAPQLISPAAAPISYFARSEYATPQQPILSPHLNPPKTRDAARRICYNRH